MVIVDTTVWIDYLRGIENPETHWLDLSLQDQRLGLTDLILSKVLQGIRNQSTFAQVQNDLLKFHVFNTGGPELAIAAARNYRSLPGGRPYRPQNHRLPNRHFLSAR